MRSNPPIGGKWYAVGTQALGAVVLTGGIATASTRVDIPQRVVTLPGLKVEATTGKPGPGYHEDMPATQTPVAIPDGIEVHDRPRVESFLAARPELARDIESARQILQRLFGPDTSFSLRHLDLGAGDPGKLILAVRTQDNPEETIRKLWQFGHEWNGSLDLIADAEEL